MTMTLKDKVGKAQQLYRDAAALLEGGRIEDQKHAMDMMDDADQLKREAVEGQNLLAKAREAQDELEREAKAAAANREPSGWKSGGEYLAKVALAGRTGNTNVDPRLKWMPDDGEYAMDSKAMAENVGATGGFLVPPEYMNEIMGAMAETSIVRSRATVIPMNRRQILMPVLDQTGTSSGQSNFFGGIVSRWAEEASSKTEDTPEFRQVTLTAHKLIHYSRVSDELVADSAVSLDAFFRGPLGFAGAMAWQEDYAFLRGTGVGQPLGVINAGATITVNRNATNPPVDYENDLVNMRASLYAGTANPVWVINQALMDDIIKLSGPTGNASFIWQMDAREGVPGRLLGYPVIWSEKLPAALTAGDIVLADFTYYLLGDRQNVTIESTIFDRWQNDQTSWRAVQRIDGRPWLSSPLTFSDGTTQVSPFVILGAKST